MNSEPSGLEDQIRAQVEQTTLDSQGVFTLDRQHALKKLKTSLLPSPTYWVLKVVQAAVAAGSPQLKFLHTPSTTDISFLAHWTLGELEGAFLEPEDGEDRGLNHLKRGLWSLTQQVDGFMVTPAGQSESLNWTGKDLIRLARPAQANLVLTIHHANVDSRWLKSMHQILIDRAHTCPIPLIYNGERFDDLGRDADQPDSEAYHLKVVDLDGLAELALPPRTYQITKSDGLCQLQFPPHRPSRASAACVLHLGDDQPQQSSIHWVLDGVIVCRQPLYTKAHPCWCNLYASAAEMALDLGGFQITDTLRSAGVAYEISRAFYPALAGTKIDLGDCIRRRRKANRRAGIACGVIGATVIWTGAPGFVIGLIAGLAGIVTSSRDAAGKEEKILQTSFREMLANWPGAPSGWRKEGLT